jgi:hypothetical protein
MNMPGFTAEASLYKRSRTFRSSETGGPTNEGVIPQLRVGGLGALCMPTGDGGMVCCADVYPVGWVCWRVPPPIIIGPV